MTIELPDVNIGSQPLTSEQARLALALGLYAGRHVSLGRAAKIAGIPYIAFMDEMGKHGICLNYTKEDLEHDFEMAEKLSRKTIAA
jgi:predicted HTH domain antitoxin